MIVTRRQTIAGVSGLAAASLLPGAVRAQSSRTVRLTSVRFGSVSWLIETIRNEGLDKKYGIDLKIGRASCRERE